MGAYAIEPRFAMTDKWELFMFSDGGHLTKELDNLFSFGDKKEFQISYGGGVRFHTIIGPVGIFYGREVFRPQGVFHFALGYTF